MILSIVVICFIALMAFWWSQQGFFGSILHLAATIAAGVIAFALWEPVVYGLLLNSLPEAAWGAGLLILFGLTLWIIRLVFDKLITGNVYFNPNLDRLLGGLIGLVSGVLTAGLLVIGLQMAGLPDLLGYQGYSLDEQGKVVSDSTLIIPVDSCAAGFFSMISAGSFSPMMSEDTLDRFHPNLAQEASLFHQAAHIASRRGAKASSFSLVGDGTLKLADIPAKLPDALKPKAAGTHLAVVGIKTIVKSSDGSAASDGDGVYRVARNQVSLVYGRRSDAGLTRLAFPVGYIQNGQALPLQTKGDFAYSSAAGEVVHHFLFHIPADSQPIFARVKGVRLDLKIIANDQALLEKLLTYDPSAAPKADAAGSSSSNVDFIKVSDLLPYAADPNMLGSAITASSDGKAISSGRGTVKYDQGLLGKSIAILRVHSPANAAILQVRLGGADKSDSLLSTIRGFAKPDSAAPALYDSTGAVYYAIGTTFGDKASYKFNIDQARAIQKHADLKLTDLRPGDEAILYFQVSRGVTLTRFDLGDGKKQDIQVVVK